MREITLENYRCFRDKQTARLAPLTLLVGENSTGKTSFLAMIRVLLDVVAPSFDTPNFKVEPYDLGSFDDIIYQGEGRNDGVFEAGFSADTPAASGEDGKRSRINLSMSFGKHDAAPIPVKWRFRSSMGDAWINLSFSSAQPPHVHVQFGTARGTWEAASAVGAIAVPDGSMTPPLGFFLSYLPFIIQKSDCDPVDNSPELSPEDKGQIESIGRHYMQFYPYGQPPFAGAPVRSKPRRTYDRSLYTRDSEGKNVPMYLAKEFFQGHTTWEHLKERLEAFGNSAGLFNDISIRQLGERGSDPFQIQVTVHDNGQQGRQRNLIDVGYGVSQVLPVVTELLRDNTPGSIFLLQQPEVHLHPSAQAALGDLFCEVALQNRQLVVETHSDYLLDRVRMMVRDDSSQLKPEDVSILFFERAGSDVQIHSISFDRLGNVVGAPQSYRRFFLMETERSIGL